VPYPVRIVLAAVATAGIAIGAGLVVDAQVAGAAWAPLATLAKVGVLLVASAILWLLHQRRPSGNARVAPARAVGQRKVRWSR
jgi:hypothetical protein